MKTLGERIRELREKNDFSLRDLAAKVSLSAAFLSDVELGRRYPSEKVLANIASALRTSVEDLEKHDTRPPVEDLKRLASTNPSYGLAFRSIVDQKISPEELLRWVQRKSKEGKDDKS